MTTSKEFFSQVNYGLVGEQNIHSEHTHCSKVLGPFPKTHVVFGLLFSISYYLKNKFILEILFPGCKKKIYAAPYLIHRSQIPINLRVSPSYFISVIFKVHLVIY